MEVKMATPVSKLKSNSMALSNTMTRLALKILKEVNPAADKEIRMKSFDKDSPVQTDAIYMVDKKLDGGYESIFTYINTGTPQEQLFIVLKAQVSNSHFVTPLSQGIIRIGFF
jgi:hypothetical protein